MDTTHEFGAITATCGVSSRPDSGNFKNLPHPVTGLDPCLYKGIGKILDTLTPEGIEHSQEELCKESRIPDRERVKDRMLHVWVHECEFVWIYLCCA